MVDPPAPMKPTLVVFTGLPGTGKSTLAESLGRRLAAPVFSADWLLGSMKPAHEAIATLEPAAYSALHESVVTTLLRRQLILGQSGVADCVLDDDELSRCADIAAEYDAALAVIECVCSDAAVHRRRVEGRVRGIPGWHEIDWAHVEWMRSQLGSLTVDRLVVDAVRPLSDNEAAVWNYVSAVI